jgi:hypothetical protein
LCCDRLRFASRARCLEGSGVRVVTSLGLSRFRLVFGGALDGDARELALLFLALASNDAGLGFDPGALLRGSPQLRFDLDALAGGVALGGLGFETPRGSARCFVFRLDASLRLACGGALGAARVLGCANRRGFVLLTLPRSLGGARFDLGVLLRGRPANAPRPRFARAPHRAPRCRLETSCRCPRGFILGFDASLGCERDRLLRSDASLGRVRGFGFRCGASTGGFGEIVLARDMLLRLAFGFTFRPGAFACQRCGVLFGLRELRRLQGRVLLGFLASAGFFEGARRDLRLGERRGAGDRVLVDLRAFGVASGLRPAQCIEQLAGVGPRPLRGLELIEELAHGAPSSARARA